MVRKLIISILLLDSIFLFSQERVDSLGFILKNSIGISVLGDASILSVYYERAFPVSSSLVITSKLGVGYDKEFQLCLFGPCDSHPEVFLTLPHHLIAVLDTKRHFFELGMGGTLNGAHVGPGYLVYPILGYRSVPIRNGRPIFRIYVHPAGKYSYEDILFIPIGAAIATNL